MQFLRTAFWVILAMLIMLFTVTNWTPVTIRLWGGARLDTWLPLVVIVSFLVGAVPMWGLHRATRWSMRRKLDNAQRALVASAPSSVTVAPPTAASPDATDLSAHS